MAHYFAGVILLNQCGFLLAQHRDNAPEILGKNQWCVCSGEKENFDKDIFETGTRELFEETRYKIHPSELKLLLEDSFVNELGNEVHITVLIADYDGQQTIECREGQEIRFINPSEIETLSWYNNNQNYFKEAYNHYLKR